MGGKIWSNETRRVTKQEIWETVFWLECYVGIPLLNNMLGSTGLAETSGDIDLGVEFHYATKNELRKKLEGWLYLVEPNFNPKDWFKNSGINLHFKTPIEGCQGIGYVQTDFMFGEDIDWMKFAYRANIPEGSPYKGLHRHILLSSIVKAINPNWKWNQIVGLVERHKPSDLIISNNPEEIAKILLGQNGKVSDLDNVESIYNTLENDPMKNQKIRDFEENIAKHPLS